VRKVEIEAWALRVVEVVTGGGRYEDGGVELKSVWPDAAVTARRIAGLANAAGGEPVLWIVGLDDTRGIVDRGTTDIANWWPSVRSHFDEDTAPDLIDVVVALGDGKSVHALCWETDRAPFVVKNASGHGTIQREVPWREGTMLRSAHRSDLVRILAPMVRAPRLEVTEAKLKVWLAASERGVQQVAGPAPDLSWYLVLGTYFTAARDAYAVFPTRLMTFDLDPGVGGSRWQVKTVDFQTTRPLRILDNRPTGMQTIHEGIEQLIVEGHGYAWFHVRGRVAAIDGVVPAAASLDRIALRASLVGVDLGGPVSAECVLKGTHRSERGDTSTLAEWTGLVT